jgi:molecular chaperone IbpA
MSNHFLNLPEIFSGYTDNYPPFSLLQHDEHIWDVELAVAGFEKDQLSATLYDGTLTLTGKANDETSIHRTKARFIHQGIARRSFIRKFKLPAHAIVTSVKHELGILKVRIERKLPAKLQPKQLQIT